MTGARVYPPLLVAVALAGCGSEAADLAPPAKPRTIELGWSERSGPPGRGFVFRVDRIVVTRNGWRADVSVTNDSPVDYRIQRPHLPGKSIFGLVVLETADDRELRRLTARLGYLPPFLEHHWIMPPTPPTLRARTTWRGSMGAPTVLREGLFARVVFGRFARYTRSEGLPRSFWWVTDHAVRL
jgi:hypothetical protein